MAHVLYKCTRGKVWSIAQLSRKLSALGIKGASVSNLSRVIQGYHEPGYGLIVGLAKALEVSLDEATVILAGCRKLYRSVMDGLEKCHEIDEAKGGG